MAEARKKVLIVDDSQLLLDVAEEAMTAAGFEVRVAKNLEELAHEKSRLNDDPPDIILMDVEMPEAFGDDIAQLMRRMDNISLPIYLFSSLPASELAELVESSGVDGYFTKTDGIDKLVEQLRTLLSGDSAVEG